MAIKITCGCGKRYSFKDERAGKRFRCKMCGDITTIPNRVNMRLSLKKTPEDASDAEGTKLADWFSTFDWSLSNPVIWGVAIFSSAMFVGLATMVFPFLGILANGFIGLVCAATITVCFWIIVIKGFQEDILQGLLCLFFPLYIPFYAYMNWYEVRRPIMSMCLAAAVAGTSITAQMIAVATIVAPQMVQQHIEKTQEQQLRESVAEQSPLQTFPRYGTGGSVAFAPKHDIAAAAGPGPFIRLWNPVKPGTQERLLKQHKTPPNALAFSPNGLMLASCGAPSTLIVWDIENLTMKSELTGHTGAVNSVEFSPDGQFLVTASADRSVRIWNIDTGRTLHDFKDRINGFAQAIWSPDQKHLAMFNTLGQSIVICDANTAEESFKLTGANSRLMRIAYSPDGQRIAAACANGDVQVWDVKTKAVLASVKAHESNATFVAFSPNGKLIASSGADMMIKLWDNDLKQATAVLKGHSASVKQFQFNGNGSRLLSVAHYADPNVLLWKMDSPSQDKPQMIANSM